MTFNLAIIARLDILNTTCGLSSPFGPSAFSSPQSSNGWSSFPPTPTSSRSSSPVEDELRLEAIMVRFASFSPCVYFTNHIY